MDLKALYNMSFLTFDKVIFILKNFLKLTNGRKKKERFTMIIMIIAMKQVGQSPVQDVLSAKECNVPLEYRDNFLKFEFTSIMEND